jgi:outer membrane lipoprotein-sorting protein
MKSTLRKLILEEKNTAEHKPDAHFESNLQKILNNKIEILKSRKITKKSKTEAKPFFRTFWFKPLFLAASIVLILVSTLSISRRTNQNGIVTLAQAFEEIRKKADKFNPSEQIVHHKYTKTKYDANEEIDSRVSFEIWDDINDYKIRHITFGSEGKTIQINDGNFLWIYNEKEKLVEKRTGALEIDGEENLYKEPYTQIGKIIGIENEVEDNPNIDIYQVDRDGKRVIVLEKKDYGSAIDGIPTLLKYRYYFEKDTFELLEWQILQADGPEFYLIESNKLELLEYINKNDLKIKEIFIFDLKLPDNVKIIETKDPNFFQ